MEKVIIFQEVKQNMTFELMIKVVNTVRMRMMETSLKKLIEKEEVLTILVYVPD